MRRTAQLIACSALWLAAAAHARVYTFTNIVDSTQQLITTGVQCLAPAINNSGELAFIAGSGSVRGIYKSASGVLTPIATTNFGGQIHAFDETECHGPSINNAGKVAFYASTPALASDGIYIGDGVSVATVADSGGAFGLFSGGCCKPFVMINESGKVAFVARFDAGGAEALYVGDENAITPLYHAGNSPFVSYEGGPSINDAGTVAFFGFSSNFASDGLFVGNGGLPTQLFDYNTDWCSLSLETGIDPAGRASFAGELGPFPSCVGDTTIFLATPSGHAPLVPGPVVPFWFDPPSFAASNEIAFNGGPLGGPNGIFSGGSVGSAVIRVGDALFGSTVTRVNVGRQGLNDSGHVAFWYALADGRDGYARANLVPDCQNGLDDDADGKTDTFDTGCANASDLSERTTLYKCDDGADNDADGLVDFPFDAGCASAKGKKENPFCSDGLDNDLDGFIDYPADTFCKGPTGSNEAPAAPGSGGCGIGPELLLAIPLLASTRRKLRSARNPS
jgi:hypothetical protein